MFTSRQHVANELKIEFLPACFAKRVQHRLLADYKGPFTQAIFVAQLNAIFVALKLQLQYRTCKPAAISARF